MHVVSLQNSAVQIPEIYRGSPSADQFVCTFEDVVLGVGGAEFYHDALASLDKKALTSPTMTKALETYRKI